MMTAIPFRKCVCLATCGLFASFGAFSETLQSAIQFAVNGHPEVKASVNSRLSADSDLRAAKGRYLPSITLTAGTGRQEVNSPTTSSVGLNRQESGISLSQTVFDGFATSSEVGRQRATVDSRANKVMSTSEATALSGVTAYIDVLQREEFVRLAQENLTSHERIYDQIKLRSDQGVGRLADLDQAEARLAQARNNLLTEQTNLEDAKTNYFSAIGKEAADLTVPGDAEKDLPATIADAQRTMIANNPLLKSADADIDATNEQYEAAKSTFYPQVSVEMNRTMDKNVDGVRGHNDEWQAMVRLRYNLYQGGSDKADMQSKAYKIREAQDIRDNALRTLNEDMRLAWSALNNARQQLPIATDYATRSARVRTAYQQQFSLGERTLLDLLDSENERFTSQRREVELRYLLMYSEYRVKARMGVLLKTMKITPPDAANTAFSTRKTADLPSLN